MIGFHKAIAVKAGEVWLLEDDEARLLAQSFADVQEHFPAVKVDPKWVALGTFGMTVSAVYGQRIASTVAARHAGKVEPGETTRT